MDESIDIMCIIGIAQGSAKWGLRGAIAPSV